jgi:hypothetical protein
MAGMAAGTDRYSPSIISILQVLLHCSNYIVSKILKTTKSN